MAADRGGTAIGRLEYQRRPEVASMPVRLPPRPVFLAGREGLLAELDARLAGGPGRPGPRVAVLYGLGGAGKTSVAVEYAHRHLAEVGVCWQFPAEDREVLAAEFGVLAAQLGAREVVDPRDPVASVHGVLARAQAGWLVVFDNAPDRAAVERFVPPAGPGRVLITTQNQHWPPGQAMDVPVLDVEVAADFLVNRTGDPDRAAARVLAAELGGLPLALEQAAAYMQATGTTLARYLPLFRDRQADLLARGEASGHPADVAATLGLALSRLAEDAPPAAGLVRLLAFLAPEPVPLNLLLTDEQAAGLLGPEVAAEVGPVLGDPVAAGDAMTALRRYSLVTPAGDGVVLVHRMVQAITRAQLSAEEAGLWGQAAAALVELAVPADPELPASWPVGAVLLPHARAVLDLTSGGMWQIARYLGFSGSYPAARDLSQLIADASQRMRPTGPSTPRPWPPAVISPAGPGGRGMRPGPATSSPPCCPSMSGSWAPSIPTPWSSAATSPAGPGRRGMRPGPGISSPPCCPSTSGSWAPSTRTPWRPGATSPAGPGRRGMRPGPGISSPPCCPSASGSWAPSTPTPWPPATSSPAGPGRRGMRPGPGISSPPCCPSANGSRAPSTRTP